MAPNGFLRRARARARTGERADAAELRCSQECPGPRKYGGTLNYRNRWLSSHCCLSFSLQHSTDRSCTILSAPMKTFHSSPRGLPFCRSPVCVRGELFVFANNLSDISVTSTARAVSPLFAHFSSGQRSLVFAVIFRAVSCAPGELPTGIKRNFICQIYSEIFFRIFQSSLYAGKQVGI